MIFGVLNLEKIWHRWLVCLGHIVEMYIVLLNCQIFISRIVRLRCYWNVRFFWLAVYTERNDMSVIMLTENKVELLHVEQVAVGTLSTEVPNWVGEWRALSRFDKEFTIIIFMFYYSYIALTLTSHFYSPVSPVYHIIIIIIIIIMWLVQRRTLPFLRVCSMPVDSALSDRRLLDQCWEVQGQTRRSEARCDAVGRLDISSPLVKGLEIIYIIYISYTFLFLTLLLVAGILL